MIGREINVEGSIFKITQPISVGRDNADIYLCEDANSEKYIAKYFCNRTPTANIGYAKYNHYGRGRDGSNHVFNEIKRASQSHSFIIKHHYRIKFDGSWLIIIEYVKGPVLKDFIRKNYSSDIGNTIKAIQALANTLALWHNEGFAHGDPHLENAILTIDDNGNYSVRLIDYSQLHHNDFYYCKEYDCFHPNLLKRIKEDLENSFHGKLGLGFRTDIISLQEELSTDNTLLQEFDNTYNSEITFSLK